MALEMRMTKNKTERKEVDMRSGCLGMAAMVVVTALIAFGVLLALGLDLDASEEVGIVLILCGLVGAIAFFRLGRKRPSTLPSDPKGKISAVDGDGQNEDPAS